MSLTPEFICPKFNSDTLVTGRQWRMFFQEYWPEGWYIDDIGVAFENEDGKYVLPDDAVRRLGDFGCVGEHNKPVGPLMCVSVLFDHVMNPLKTNQAISPM